MNSTLQVLILANADDIAQCALIDRNMGFYTNSSIWQKATNDGRLLIAKINSQVVGYLRYGYLWDEELPCIQMLRVDQISRKKGVGKKLIQALEDILKQQGIKYLLSSTDVSNTNSLLFYKALSFQECGNLDINQDGILEVFLKKKLLRVSPRFVRKYTLRS